MSGERVFDDDSRSHWALVRIKRAWVPEWLWRAAGQLPVKQPLRFVLTREMTADEAVRYWSEG